MNKCYLVEGWSNGVDYERNYVITSEEFEGALLYTPDYTNKWSYGAKLKIDEYISLFKEGGYSVREISRLEIVIMCGTIPSLEEIGYT